MFARRHYRIIAQIIADLSLSNDEHDDLGLIELDALRESIARQFADGLAASNSNFNRSRFLTACLLQKKPPRVRKTSASVVLKTFACPRCQKRTQATVEGLKCGDCLMNDCEVVSLQRLEDESANS